jgi:xanthine dehydrogenase accessory factor
MKNIYLQIPLGSDDILSLALATVTMTEGSTPQKPGSSALFDTKGLIAGTVGGGVLEGKVQEKALESLITKKPQHHVFMLDASAADGEDALCGGKISVLIDPELAKHKHVFEALRRSYEKRIPGLLITLITDTANNDFVVNRYWVTENERDLMPADLIPFNGSEISDILSGSGNCDLRRLELTGQDDNLFRLLFIEPVIPAPRLVIAGAGHIGKALAQIGSMLGFEITVIDDRPEFANNGNIPWSHHIINGDIGNAIEVTDKKDDTYIVIVTRGHKDDGDALKACIGSDAAYIGMIGSKTKVALMKKEFINKGWATQEQWDRIFAPIGLDIKSKTIEEIAVSIAAQLVQVKNTPRTPHLVTRTTL